MQRSVTQRNATQRSRGMKEALILSCSSQVHVVLWAGFVGTGCELIPPKDVDLGGDTSRRMGDFRREASSYLGVSTIDWAGLGGAQAGGHMKETRHKTQKGKTEVGSRKSGIESKSQVDKMNRKDKTAKIDAETEIVGDSKKERDREVSHVLKRRDRSVCIIISRSHLFSWVDTATFRISDNQTNTYLPTRGSG
ncbi:hypothetical protein WAI453_006815 [Rhynchosporium graminicola]